MCLSSFSPYISLSLSQYCFFFSSFPSSFILFLFHLLSIVSSLFLSLSLSFFKELNGSCLSENNNSIRVLRQLAGHRHHHCRQNKFVRNKKQIVAPPQKKEPRYLGRKCGMAGGRMAASDTSGHPFESSRRKMKYVRNKNFSTKKPVFWQ